MLFTKNEVTTGKEILKRKLGGELLEPITIHSTAFTNGKLAAGTAVDEDGKVAAGGNAVGITINDCYSDNPNTSILKAFGVVWEKNCTISSEDKAALNLIIFE